MVGALPIKIFPQDFPFLFLASPYPVDWAPLLPPLRCPLFRLFRLVLYIPPLCPYPLPLSLFVALVPMFCLLNLIPFKELPWGHRFC